MWNNRVILRWARAASSVVLLTTLIGRLNAQSESVQPSATNIVIRVVEGEVEVLRAGAQTWDLARTNQVLYTGDRVRTRENSRITLLFSNQSVARIGPLSEFAIEPPIAPNKQPGFSLSRGLLYFFHRDKPAALRINTRTAAAAIEGTEFNLAAEDSGRTVLTLVDGKVELSNAQGSISLTSGEQGIAEPGKPPTKTAVVNAINVIQWALYYPAVLDLDELSLSQEEQQSLERSLTAYRSGDLLRALADYPSERTPSSSAEKVYLGALLLAVGQVEQTEKLFDSLPQNGDPGATNNSNAALAGAVRQLIAAVKFQPWQRSRAPELATEWLAESYYRQSQADLPEALLAARKAVEKSPNFGFGWARVAELEFSFGRVSDAVEALEKSLRLAPRNAEALALKGFLLGAQNRIREAITYFEQAMAVDGALGNAWLGRGLCRIRRGETEAGREDLLVAAALEPQRALLRSYLGKAYGDAGDRERAAKELALARKLDPKDPTAWLYFALFEQQNNQINDAVRDLEKSQELNDNRRVYRSRLLLDQDRAVRSANLARLYADADLDDVAVREAGRGVAADYANYSAHLFLANSYEVQRRANPSNLRFEAASFNEYLLANLLGPANGRLLAQPVTQLEYSTLFERNRLGVIANTEYFSRGAWHHSSAHYGTWNGSSYSLEAEYRSEPGERVNQNLEIRQLEAKLKQDVTPDDSVLFHVIDYRASGGDTVQHFDEGEVRRTFRFREKQTPTVLAGYHHQWSPQNHTLVLVGRLDDTFESSDPNSAVLTLDRFLGTVIGFVPVTVRETYRSRVEVYTAEAQQIAVLGSHSLIAGARVQWSKQNLADRVADPNGDFLHLLGTNNPVSVQREDVWSSSAAIYAYDYLRLADTLQIVGGLNFTHQSIPVNSATAPVSSQRDHQERVSPKAAIIWSPSPSSSIRASYTSSLTGSGLGQSVRLEPTQVAGMLQTFRAPAPSSLVGQLDGADLETAELLWEGRFRDTYLSLGGQWLAAERDRSLGLFLSDPNYDPPPSLGLIQEQVRFREYALDVSAHQLVGEEWSFGVRYRLAYAQLKRSFPEYPGLAFGGLDDNSDWQGWLQTLTLSGLYRHHSGLFARAEGVLFAQDRKREGLSLPGDNFWQVNATVGYRFPRQKAEVAVGVLNAFDNDYRLDPINQHADQPRSRTFYARLLLNF